MTNIEILQKLSSDFIDESKSPEYNYFYNIIYNNNNTNVLNNTKLLFKYFSTFKDVNNVRLEFELDAGIFIKISTSTKLYFFYMTCIKSKFNQFYFELDVFKKSFEPIGSKHSYNIQDFISKKHE
jgi:hypothetical protein